MTGRHKVMTRYRSYHGGTVMTLAMSGDQRRWPAEAGASGHVHFFDPYPYSFSMGDTAEEVAYQSLTMLREQILYEGPHTVAAIVMESITGTNGILKPPPGYSAPAGHGQPCTGLLAHNKRGPRAHTLLAACVIYRVVAQVSGGHPRDVRRVWNRHGLRRSDGRVRPHGQDVRVYARGRRPRHCYLCQGRQRRLCAPWRRRCPRPRGRCVGAARVETRCLCAPWQCARARRFGWLPLACAGQHHPHDVCHLLPCPLCAPRHAFTHGSSLARPQITSARVLLALGRPTTATRWRWRRPTLPSRFVCANAAVGGSAKDPPPPLPPVTLQIMFADLTVCARARAYTCARRATPWILRCFRHTLKPCFAALLPCRARL